MRSHLPFHRAFALLAGVGLALACAPPPPAQPVAPPRYGIEAFMGNTILRGLSFSPDGKRLLVATDQTGVFNAYAFSVDGQPPVALTQSTTNPVIPLGFFPDGERLLYTSDEGGNENNHLFVRAADGSVRDLTPGKDLKAQFLGWSKDDRSFFAATNERVATFFDIYEYDVDTFERTKLYEDKTGYEFGAISDDRRFLAFGKSRTTYDSDVFLLDRQSGEMKNITVHQGNESNSPMTFTPDNQGLLLLTDAGHEFSYLQRYDIATGERKEFVKTDWDVAFASYSETGRYLEVAVNKDARTEIRLYEAATLTPVALPTLPEAEITSLTLSDDETKIAFFASTSRTPSNLYLADLAAGARPTRLTQTLNPAIDEKNLVDAQVVRFKSYDGVEIPGILYRPIEATPEQKVPALVWVHGGPGGQSRVGYSELIQYLVNHGYAVYAINNRGSSGYGKTFYTMDDKRHGEADLDDVVASKKMLIDTGWIDPQKIGIIGGSYGGYMTLAALTFRPEEFAVGVDIFGPANWLRTLESIPPYWESFREALYQEMGDPATDRERLQRISPLFHADKIRRPLMVLQGANDPRVLQVESDEIVAAVRKNNVPVEYIVFPDEGHGFQNKVNRTKAYESILAFVDQHLKGGTKGPASL
ncbi:MAG: S9 family peptidase [Thermoanaerobaculia bacterium]|nr:S9 family peptidase [Thermoanaerobaculia bacterium]